LPDWDEFLEDLPDSGMVATPGTRPADRLLRALRELGPGLADAAFRCCCLLEGLETVEKRMGWSARSGKVVLRLALWRLQTHYRSEDARASPLLG
jgi:cystathionine beta-lyase/cystathionine gamma-synthase